MGLEIGTSIKELGRQIRLCIIVIARTQNVITECTLVEIRAYSKPSGDVCWRAGAAATSYTLQGSSSRWRRVTIMGTMGRGAGRYYAYSAPPV